jgi:hypothetical protein
LVGFFFSLSSLPQKKKKLTDELGKTYPPTHSYAQDIRYTPEVNGDYETVEFLDEATRAQQNNAGNV